MPADGTSDHRQNWPIPLGADCQRVPAELVPEALPAVVIPDASISMLTRSSRARRHHHTLLLHPALKPVYALLQSLK